MGLWWQSTKYTLPSGKTIDEVKNEVATNAYYSLRSLGYTTTVQPGDVTGEKTGVIVLVGYLQISGSDYWEVVICSGSQTDRNTVVSTLGILHTDYF